MVVKLGNGQSDNEQKVPNHFLKIGGRVKTIQLLVCIDASRALEPNAIDDFILCCNTNRPQRKLKGMTLLEFREAYLNQIFLMSKLILR